MGKLANQIYCCDFETITSNTNYYKKFGDTKVILGVIQNLNNPEEVHKFVKIEDFFKYFEDNEISAIVYFHNLRFDGDFILKYLAKKKYPFCTVLPHKGIGVSFFRQGANIYNIKYKYYKNKHYRILDIRCSFKILSAPISALGKAVGVSKYLEGQDDSSFYDVEPQRKIDDYDKAFVDYCVRDVEIMCKSLKYFDESFQTLKEREEYKKVQWKSKLTSSAISFKLQKASVKHFHPECLNGLFHTRDENEIADKFFYGGLSQFNDAIQGEVLRGLNGVVIDINSAHPHSMTKLLPYGEILYEPPEEGEYLEFVHLKIKEARIKKGDLALLLNWKYNNNSKNLYDKYRYVFVLENFECYYLKQEFDVLKHFYDFKGVKVMQTYYLRAKRFLKEFVENVYFFKEKYSMEKKKALAQTFKIVLNSGYGIHARRCDYKNYIVCKDKQHYDSLKAGDEIEFMKRKYRVLDSKSELHELPNVYIKVVEEIGNVKAHNKFIASTITAYTRMTLYDAILKVGIENILYVDTDSLYIENKPPNLGELVELHSTKLGAWDTEGEFSTFIVKGAKCYACGDDEKPIKAKYSGISEKVVKDNMNYNFWRAEEIIPDANLGTIRCRSGLILEYKDYKPKERLH